MNIDFKLPELGEDIDSGDVINVLVAEGETLQPDQGVLELETDKAVVEIPCPDGGTIAKIHVSKGETIKVGQVILTLESDSSAEEQPPEPAEAQAAEAQAAEAQAAEEPPGAQAAPEPSPAPASAAPSDPIPAGPAVRRLARESGVDLRQVPGSGPHGRVTLEDVRARTGASGAAITTEAVVLPGEPGQDDWGPVRRDRVSRIRRTIAAQMVRSASTIPHVTNFDDADVTDLDHLRKGVPEGSLGPGVKLTMMPFVMKAVALALRRHPMVNASLDEENNQIIYKQYVHLGVAVDTPRGLVVPAVRNADEMSVFQLARELATLAQRARAAELSVEELRGGTFTLSNLGAVGGSYSTPIINHPEVAILLLGRSRRLPAVYEEEVELRLMLPLSLSYDHRVVDGAAAARFLNEVIDHLQSPARLLLGDQ